MGFPQISFQVRTRSAASPDEIARRVGKVLGCGFVPSSDRMFEPGEALEAFALGLHITIRHDPEIPEGAQRTYMVMGMLRGDIEARWGDDAPTISITEYLLGLLRLCDGPDWYAPTLEEQLQEAGLPAEQEVVALQYAQTERGQSTFVVPRTGVAVQPAGPVAGVRHGGTAVHGAPRAAEAVLKGLVSADELARRKAEWDAAARATPHGQPIELAR